MGERGSLILFWPACDIYSSCPARALEASPFLLSTGSHCDMMLKELFFPKFRHGAAATWDASHAGDPLEKQWIRLSTWINGWSRKLVSSMVNVQESTAPALQTLLLNVKQQLRNVVSWLSGLIITTKGGKNPNNLTTELRRSEGLSSETSLASPSVF